MSLEVPRRWLTVAAVAVSTALVLLLFMLGRGVEQRRPAQEEEQMEKAYQGLSGDELSRAVYREAAGLAAEATAELPLSAEQRAFLREEFLEAARSQCRQLERLYLVVLRKLAEGDPRYLAAVEGRSGWPYDQFEIDFRAFQRQRAGYRPALSDDDREIDARLEAMESELQQVLSGLPSRREAFDEIEDDLRQQLQRLAQEIKGAGKVSRDQEAPGQPSRATPPSH
jgi:hypothetical protein